MTTRTLLLTLLCGGGIAVTGCKSAEGPVAGELEVRLTTPNTDDRAILVRVVGKQTAIAAPSGSTYRVLTAPLGGDTVRVVVIAPVGSHIAAGAMLRLTVPDTRQVDAYSAFALDVASASYAQRPLTGYLFAVAKP
jgi:hypothetical protein